MKHLLQILYAVDPRKIDILNKQWAWPPLCNPITNERSNRFTKISLFGLNTIHCFPLDVADTSQQPAWFFEQVLQVRTCSNLLLVSNTQLVPLVFHPHVQRSLSSCIWLKHSTAPILTLRMAYIGQAWNAHRQFAHTPPAVLTVSWQSATPFSTRHVHHVSCLGVTHESCTATKEEMAHLKAGQWKKKHVLPYSWKHSTLTLIGFTPLETIPPWSKCLEWLTLSPPRS